MHKRQASAPSVVRGVLALLLLGGAALVPVQSNASTKVRPGWESQVLDFVDDADTYTATRTYIDTGPSGRSVILYASGPRHNSGFKMYVSRGPNHDGSFRRQWIDPDDKLVTGFGALAVGPKGRAHVSYTSGIFADQCVLKYAVSSPTGWKIEVADPVKSAGFTSIALDSRRHPVIAYSKVVYGLWTATRGPGGWTTSPVVGDERVWALDVAVDADDNPRIAYVVAAGPDVANFVVKLATFDGESWSIETVGPVSPGGIEFGVDLLIDADGNDDIVFPVADPAMGLTYAHRVAGTWQLDPIDLGNLWQPTATYDAIGGLHVTYYNANRGALKYAALDAGVWNVRTIADNKSESIRTGRQSSITIDADGHARVAYYVGNQFTGTVLRYSVSDGPVPLPGVAGSSRPDRRGAGWTVLMPKDPAA